MASAPGYSDLGPQQVLAALDAVGLHGDGRILQLNSYENRVFQVFLENGRAVVAKFYRPGRWSDAAIQEEHDFAWELARGEIPVVPPLRLAQLAGQPDNRVLQLGPLGQCRQNLRETQRGGAICRARERCGQAPFRNGPPRSRASSAQRR